MLRCDPSKDSPCHRKRNGKKRLDVANSLTLRTIPTSITTPSWFQHDLLLLLYESTVVASFSSPDVDDNSSRWGENATTNRVCLLDVLRQEAAMEVVANSVIHKSLLRLGLSPRLSFENHIIVPPAANNNSSTIGLRDAYWVIRILKHSQ